MANLGFYPAQVVDVKGTSIICYVENTIVILDIEDLRSVTKANLGGICHEVNEILATRAGSDSLSGIDYAIAFFWKDTFAGMRVDFWTFYGLGEWPTGALSEVFLSEDGRVKRQADGLGCASTNTHIVLGVEAHHLHLQNYHLKEYLESARPNLPKYLRVSIPART